MSRGLLVVSAGLILTIVLFANPASANAQTGEPDEFGWYTITPETTKYDQLGSWTLHFRFKKPRIITTEMPGRGKKVIYYMLYELINRTGEPQTVIPKFTLRTLDKFTTHSDEISPKVQQAIIKIEDPTPDRRLNIRNSVTLSKRPILPTEPDSAPIVVRGVAIWSDVYDRAPDTNQFSIFVGGLSNGVFQGDDGVIRRKTLQLDFRRIGDADVPKAEQIKFVDNNDPWIYRATSVNLRGDDAAPGNGQ